MRPSGRWSAWGRSPPPTPSPSEGQAPRGPRLSSRTVRLAYWAVGSFLGVVLWAQYGPEWFLVGPLWAMVMEYLSALPAKGHGRKPEE